jgi:hypothetical protein
MREGGTRVFKVFGTKAEEEAAGRTTAMRESVEHLITTPTTGSPSISYGNDPARPVGLIRRVCSGP